MDGKKNTTGSGTEEAIDYTESSFKITAGTEHVTVDSTKYHGYSENQIKLINQKVNENENKMLYQLKIKCEKDLLELSQTLNKLELTLINQMGKSEDLQNRYKEILNLLKLDGMYPPKGCRVFDEDVEKCKGEIASLKNTTHRLLMKDHAKKLENIIAFRKIISDRSEAMCPEQAKAHSSNLDKANMRLRHQDTNSLGLIGGCWKIDSSVQTLFANFDLLLTRYQETNNHLTHAYQLLQSPEYYQKQINLTEKHMDQAEKDLLETVKSIKMLKLRANSVINQMPKYENKIITEVNTISKELGIPLGELAHNYIPARRTSRQLESEPSFKLTNAQRSKCVAHSPNHLTKNYGKNLL